MKPYASIFFLAYALMISFIAISLISVIIHKIGMGLKDWEIEKRMSELKIMAEKYNISQSNNSIISSDLKNEQEINIELRLLVNDLFNEKFKIFNSLCNQYFDIGNSDKHKIQLYYQSEREIKRICEKHDFIKLEDIVNKCRDNILVKYKQQFPLTTDNDYMLLALIYSGLQPRAICILTDTKLKTFYTRRSRLKHRIENSDASDKMLFLNAIENK